MIVINAFLWEPFKNSVVIEAGVDMLFCADNIIKTVVRGVAVYRLSTVVKF